MSEVCNPCVPHSLIPKSLSYESMSSHIHIRKSQGPMLLIQETLGMLPLFLKTVVSGFRTCCQPVFASTQALSQYLDWVFLVPKLQLSVPVPVLIVQNPSMCASTTLIGHRQRSKRQPRTRAQMDSGQAKSSVFRRLPATSAASSRARMVW